MKALQRLLTRQDGFSLIEVLVAASVLVTGLMGTMTLIGQADSATLSNSAREGAVNLQRELIEAAKSIPYDQLTPNSIVARVQAQAGLGDASLADAGWTIRRRGFTYTVSMGTCAVDDSRDGYGAHDAGVFCASGAGGTPARTCLNLLRTSADGQLPGESAPVGTASGDCGIDRDFDGTVDSLIDPTGTTCSSGCDSYPADYKRIVSLVRWDRGGGARYVLQDSTAANPGLAAAPAVAGLAASASNPVTSATSIAFTATASPDPAAVTWYLDGTQRGTASGSGSTWSFTWPLGTVGNGSVPGTGEVVDGSYQIGAKAFDRYGQGGMLRSATIVLNRRAPYPPQNLLGGRNGSLVELAWSPNKERDIEGYRVYRLDAGTPVLVCALTSRSSCQDPAPPSGASLSYYAVALDKDTSGNLREGTPSATITVSDTNTPPPAPRSLSASTSSGNTLLVWTAPLTNDPDPGDAIDHYVIYRDGTKYADRYDRTATASQLSFTDSHTNGMAHTYWVASVDTQLAESTLVGPVTK